MNELNIAWMYPDILNLHGDRGNIMALKRVGEMMGLTVNVTKIEKYDDPVCFEETDILFFNPGEIKVMPSVIEALKKRKDVLDEYIGAGKTAVCIAGAGAVMAKSLTRADASVFEGLGYLDMECKERETVYGDDIHFEISGQEIIGCQIQMMDAKLTGAEPLGRLIYGMGNNEKGTKNEGARYKNVIFTNALGPVMVKNPWFAETLIKEAMRQKGVTIEEGIPPEEFDLELKSMECIKEFIKNAPKED